MKNYLYEKTFDIGLSYVISTLFLFQLMMVSVYNSIWDYVLTIFIIGTYFYIRNHILIRKVNLKLPYKAYFYMIAPTIKEKIDSLLPDNNHIHERGLDYKCYLSELIGDFTIIEKNIINKNRNESDDDFQCIIELIRIECLGYIIFNKFYKNRKLRYNFMYKNLAEIDANNIKFVENIPFVNKLNMIFNYFYFMIKRDYEFFENSVNMCTFLSLMNYYKINMGYSNRIPFKHSFYLFTIYSNIFTDGIKIKDLTCEKIESIQKSFTLPDYIIEDAIAIYNDAMRFKPNYKINY